MGFGVLFGFAGYSHLIHSDLTFNLKLYADKDHHEPMDILVQSRTVYTITFEYGSENEERDKRIEWYTVANFMRNFIDRLDLENDGSLSHSENSNYSVGIHTGIEMDGQERMVSIEILTNSNTTKLRIQRERIKEDLQDLMDHKYNFGILVLLDTVKVEEVDIIDECEPIYAINDSFQIIKRLTLIYSLSMWSYLDLADEEKDFKSDLIVFKNLLFCQCQSSYSRYHQRHFIHTEQDQEREDDGKEEELKEELVQEDELRKVEKENISFTRIAKQIDLYYHVNGIAHFVLSNSTFTELFWIMTLVKLSVLHCLYNINHTVVVIMCKVKGYCICRYIVY